MNRSMISVMSVVVAFSIGCPIANASIQFVDVDYHNTYFNKDEGGVSTLTWTLDITSAEIENDSYTISGYSSGNGDWKDAGGFIVGTDVVTNAIFDVWVKDNGDNQADKFRLNVVDYASGNQSATLNFFSNKATAKIIGDIQEDGKLQLTMMQQVGDFYLAYSALEVTVADRPAAPAANPEPASLAVWSVLIMVGVGCCYWRKRKQ